MKIDKSPIRLYASAEAVINKFLYLPGKDREKNVIERIKNFSEAEVHKCLAVVMKDFSARHRDIEGVFLDHFSTVSTQFEEDVFSFSDSRKILLGAYFTKEYSIQAAALFNPSIVPHPDQSDLPPGAQRFIMSLRATGEGHISSITFRTGIIHADHRIDVLPPAGFLTEPRQIPNPSYDKALFERKLFELGLNNEFTRRAMDKFGESFALEELRASLEVEM